MLPASLTEMLFSGFTKQNFIMAMLLSFVYSQDKSKKKKKKKKHKKHSKKKKRKTSGSELD